jgi:hypothetical protein
MAAQTIQRIRRIAAGTARVGTCLAFVAATTWAAFSVLRVNSLIAGFAYVLVVLVVAAKWGLAESFLTSVAAMLCLNYFFLPPILSLTIADPQNWVALFAFLVTAITATKLSSTARQRADEAQARRIEVEHLYQFSRSLMLIDSTRDLGTQIAGQVKERFGFSRVAYCDGLSGELSMVGLPDAMLEHKVLRDIAVGTASWFVWRHVGGECFQSRSRHRSYGRVPRADCPGQCQRLDGEFRNHLAPCRFVHSVFNLCEVSEMADALAFLLRWRRFPGACFMASGPTCDVNTACGAEQGVSDGDCGSARYHNQSLSCFSGRLRRRLKK